MALDLLAKPRCGRCQTPLGVTRSRREDTRVTTDSPLSRLQGSELAQVWFVRDYLQLIFEGEPKHWSLQCYAWPAVQREGRRVGFGETGYRDDLCDLIGSVMVSGTESESAGLSIVFDEGSLTLNPATAELVGPEIAMLHVLGEPGDWMVWRPGEKPFLHLA